MDGFGPVLDELGSDVWDVVGVEGGVEGDVGTVVASVDCQKQVWFFLTLSLSS